ncbi:MAG: tryptophan synthase subunit alpha [Clostridiales bacterium]|nr:tryptophan synthase subunit alpha [Clostridiales bacterium]
MSNRIDAMFEKKKKQGKKALITFITAGDPDINTTRRLVLAMEAAGADLIELGVPYSDPVAEGPVIQAASVRALKNGVRMDALFDLVESLRQDTQAPIVFLLYFNSILQHGPDRFFYRCARAGVDGVIVPDLPLEESGEIHGDAKRHGVCLIRLVAPTSGDRIEAIAQKAEGFLYCVSSLGVTGVRSSFSTDFGEFFGRIDRSKAAPSAIGFGVSTPEQAAALKKYCDGVIVGSAIVRRVGAAENADAAVKEVSDFVRGLRAALDDKG